MAPENLKIIGTAHVSKESIEEVKEAIITHQPDVVAVELDINRYQNMIAEKNGQEKQNVNALEIAKQSGDLYDKFVGFTDDLIEVGKKLDIAKVSYSDAMKKLTEGRGNLVSRAENIKQLGAKTTKSLPQALLDRSNEDSNLFNNGLGN